MKNTYGNTLHTVSNKKHATQAIMDDHEKLNATQNYPQFTNVKTFMTKIALPKAAFVNSLQCNTEDSVKEYI